MKSLIVEMLLGHSVGLADSYFRPTQDEMLSEYMKAVPDLAVFEKIVGMSQDVESLKSQLELERSSRQSLEERLARIEAALAESLRAS